MITVELMTDELKKLHEQEHMDVPQINSQGGERGGGSK